VLWCSYRTSIFCSVVKSRNLQLAINVTKIDETNKWTPDLDRENYFTWFIGRWHLSRIGGLFDICQKFERMPRFYITDGSLKRRNLYFNLHNVTPQFTIIFKITKRTPKYYIWCIYIYIFAHLTTFEDSPQTAEMCSLVESACFPLWNCLDQTSPVLGSTTGHGGYIELE
jgi:hypothetical protein